MKINYKSIVVKMANRLGYQIIPNWRMEDLAFANHLRYIFDALSIDFVIDVGANIGQYHDFLRNEVKYDGRIASFEPIPELFDVLKTRSLKDKKWDVYNLALGAENGKLPFNIMKSSEFSSFLSPTHENTKLFIGENQIERVDMIPVKILDDLIPSFTEKYKIKNIYLKIDTQGYDLHVLNGLQKHLGNIVALQSEMSVTKIYSQMPGYIEMMSILREKNFSPSGFFPVNPGTSPRLIEFDCCMVNNKFL